MLRGLVLCFLAVCAVTLAAPTVVEQEQQPPTTPEEKGPFCSKVLTDIGLTSNLTHDLAHILHSLTVDDLRVFEPTVTEYNNIPTVNPNLKAFHAVLRYAPNVLPPSGLAFATRPMRVIDLVLSHGSDSHWYVNGYPTMRRIGHAFHMMEEWELIRTVYERIKASPTKPSDAVCGCLTDHDTLGLMDQLRYSALSLREAALVYGRDYFWNTRDGRPKPSMPSMDKDDLLLFNTGKVVLPSRLEPFHSSSQIENVLQSTEKFGQALFLYCNLKEFRTA